MLLHSLHRGKKNSFPRKRLSSIPSLQSINLTIDMASSQVEVDEGDHVQLKHLGFLRNLTINSFILLSNLYESAKENSGQIKSTVDTVENIVASVAGPVYDKFKDVPTEILVFLDNKVDKATYKFEPALKNAVIKSQSLLNNASPVQEATVSGPRAVTISKHFNVPQLASALHGVFEMAIPKVAQLCDKYNAFVKEMAAKGYGFFGFVPLLVPVEELVEVGVEKEDEGSSSTQSESVGEEVGRVCS